MRLKSRGVVVVVVVELGLSEPAAVFGKKNADYADAGVSRLRNASLSPSATCFAAALALLKKYIPLPPIEHHGSLAG